MNNNNDKNRNFAGSVIIKAANVILAIICAFVFFLLISIYRTKQSFGWNDLFMILLIFVPILFRLKQKKPENAFEAKKLEWKTLNRKGKIYWAIVITVWVGVILFAVLGGIILPILSK